ncbi:hypothetical protein [Methylophilus luteus]|uniref:Lipoprotein n=1 Tax=Methylophilus luteus TaxID=640108 RepID=A0ABW3F336_9PROT
MRLSELISTRYVLWLLIACSATACTDDKFKNEQAFTDYVAQLALADLTLPSAIARLTAEGFNCYPEKNASHYCLREIGGAVCKQRHIIHLFSTEADQTPVKITTKFGLVCL